MYFLFFCSWSSGLGAALGASAAWLVNFHGGAGLSACGLGRSLAYFSIVRLSFILVADSFPLHKLGI